MVSASAFIRITCILAVCAVLSCVSAPDDDYIQYSSRSDDREFYDRAIAETVRLQSRVNRAHAGICSHHLLAAPYMSGFFRAFREKTKFFTPRNIIIIGPNHRSLGSSPIALSASRWKTPYGFCNPASDIITAVSSMTNASIDEDAFTYEHSIGALLPFVRYYFPKARIVPIILMPSVTRQEARALGKLISDKTDINDVLILSADFVHNKAQEGARAIDMRSRRVLENLHTYNSSSPLPIIEIDCNRGLELLMTYTMRHGSAADILIRTDSSEISGRAAPVTSYFFVLYGK